MNLKSMLTNPSEVDISITITAQAREWERFRQSLRTDAVGWALGQEIDKAAVALQGKVELGVADPADA